MRAEPREKLNPRIKAVCHISDTLMLTAAWLILALPGAIALLVDASEAYWAEPYVLAADVYAAPGHLGRGGWSWYTGAAGWYYRTAVEELLGLKVREGRLFVEPHLPEDWPGWTGEWELDRGRLSIQVSRGRELSVRLDGREIRDGVPLRELTGDHRLEVTAVPGNGKLCFSAKDVV